MFSLVNCGRVGGGGGGVRAGHRNFKGSAAVKSTLRDSLVYYGLNRCSFSLNLMSRTQGKTSDKGPGPSVIGMTSLQRTKLLAPKCPLFGGSTV